MKTGWLRQFGTRPEIRYTGNVTAIQQKSIVKIQYSKLGLKSQN